MYATYLQFDVLFPLKKILKNYSLGFCDVNRIKDKTVLEEFFRMIVRHSVQGCFGYHPYRNLKELEYDEYAPKCNPIRFAITWFEDTFDKNNEFATKIFRDVMKDYFKIERYVEGFPYYQNERLWTILDLKTFKEYTLFDIEEVFQDGIIYNGNFHKKFCKNKYQYINNKGAIYRSFNNDGLFEFLKDKWNCCICPCNEYLLVAFTGFHGCGFIVEG